MKKMTKMLSVILTVAMMAAMLVACGSSESKKSDEKTESTDSKDTIKFGTNAEFPPFEYVTQDGVIGEFDGIDMAIAKDIAEENGMEAQIENMEFDSLDNADLLSFHIRCFCNVRTIFHYHYLSSCVIWCREINCFRSFICYSHSGQYQ